MGLNNLDHYSINTDDLDGTVAFYEDVLGLKNGERPPFSFPGAWLYCDDVPVVHLIGAKATDSDGTGAFDHIAFAGSGVPEFVANLTKLGVSFEERDVPSRDVHQVFVRDPNGVKIEINFRGEATD